MEIALAAGAALKSIGTIAAGVAAKAAAGHLGAMAVQAVASAAIGVGISALSSALAPGVGVAGSPDTWSPDTDAPIPVAMGRVGGIAGFIAYRETYGPTNRYQSLITTVSLGPIRGNWVAKFDDEVTTFGTNAVATNGDHQGEMWCQFRLGAQPETAHTSPTGLEGGATLPDWSSAHKMSGKATYLLTCRENSKFTEFRAGLPNPSLEFDGGYVWDPREDGTWPGGSGACRLNDPTTWVWSDDPCIWALNWAIGRWAGPSGGGTYGVPYACILMAGLGATLDGIDVAALVNAANVSEANGWKVAARPTTKDDKHEVYRALLQAGGALPARNAGRISCITRGEVQASVVTVTAADTAGPIEVSLGQSRLERINTILPRFWSPEHDWQMIQADPVTDAAFVAEVGGITRTRGVDYPYVPDKDQAASLAYYDVADNRERFSGTIPFKPHMRRIRPGDCFTFDEPGFLLDGVKAKCLRRSIDPMTLEVTVTWRQETDAKHAAAAGETGGTGPGTDPTSPPVIDVDPPTDGDLTGTGDELTVTWTNGEDRFFRTLIYIGPDADFENATQVASKGGEPGEVQSATFKPGPGVWHVFIVTRSGGPGAYDLSVPVHLGSATTTVEISPENLDDLNVLQRDGGGAYTGDLNATEGADWGTNLDNRPEELTDGRIATALDPDGVLQTVIPPALADASDLLRHADGGIYTGDLDAVNEVYVDNAVGSLENDLLTGAVIPAEAAAFTGQGALAAKDEVDTGDVVTDSIIAVERVYDASGTPITATASFWTVIQEITVTTSGETLLVEMEAFVNMIRGNATAGNVTLNFNHVGVGSMRPDFTFTVDGNDRFQGFVPISMEYAPAAGTHTLQFRGRIDVTTNWTANSFREVRTRVTRLPTTTMPT